MSTRTPLKVSHFPPKGDSPRLCGQELAQTHRACRRDALFSGGEELSIPVPWLVARDSLSIQRT